MPLYNFTVRAKDNQGAFADRDFSINVRNTITDNVIVASTTNSISSADGTNWATRPIAKGRSIAYGNNTWVCYGTNTSAYGPQDYWISTDAINWEKYTTPTCVGSYSTHGGPAIHYGNGLWMMVCNNASNSSVHTSVDAKTWTSVGTIPNYMRGSLAYHNGKWYMTCGGGNSGSGVTPAVYYSANNGASWVASTIGQEMIHNLISVNGMLVLTRRSNSVYTSIDGINWAIRTMPSAGSSFDITYGNGVFVVASTGTALGWASKDAINWTTITHANTPTSTEATTGVGFAEGRFYIAKANKLFTSFDGFTWSEVTTGISLTDMAGVSGITMG